MSQGVSLQPVPRSLVTLFRPLPAELWLRPLVREESVSLALGMALHVHIREHMVTFFPKRLWLVHFVEFLPWMEE